MDHLDSELGSAWEELSFWRDFAVWWSVERSNSPEPRILEALDDAERRYERADNLKPDRSMT